MSPGKRLRLVKFVVFSIFLIGFSLLDVTDGWKLRDLSSQKNDEKNVTSKKTMFRDLPMKKIVKIVKVIDDDDDEDDNDDDDDDDKNSNEEESKFVFEKVHSTHFDLPLKPVAKLSQPDVEQDENEEKDENESEQQVSSFFDPIYSFTSGIFGSTDDDDDGDKGFFQWLKSFRKTEDAKEETVEEDTEEESPSWLSYLNRKPFSFVLHYFYGDDDGETDAEKHNEQHVSDRDVTPEREPLTTQKFEDLMLNIPSFIPNYTKIDDIDCKRMGQIFLRQVRGQKLWALQSK